MNVAEALAARFSCRAYLSEPVRREDVLAILAAARNAPSWANTQPWEIWVAAGEPLERVRRAYLANLEKGVPGALDIPRPAGWPATIQRRIEELMAERSRFLGFSPQDAAARQAHQVNNHRLFGAPAVVYLCMDRTLTAYSAFDLGMMAQSIMLAARERGLDTVPAVMLANYPDVLRAELGIPAELAVVIGIALGHADSASPHSKFRSGRRPLEEVARLVGY